MCMSIKGRRGSGKTTRLLELANKNCGVVVTTNTISARMIAKENGFDAIKDFITYSDYIANIKEHMRSRDLYYLDDIENFVKSMNIVDAYTASID